MTKQEKIKAWLVEQGYQPEMYKRCGVGIVWCDYGGYTYIYDETTIEQIVGNGAFLCFLGVFKNKEFIKLPDFQDDQPEPKDKALQEYCLILDALEYPTGVRCMQEINDRLKALEAANEKA